MKISKNLAGYLMPAFLVLVALFLVVKNYSSGNWLLGWDSLHPEFNLQEAFSRVFSGVWRGEQGIGAIAGHAHMAEIPRLLLVSLTSLFIKASVLRWLYIFLCLILGPLGVYYFLSYVNRREREGLGVYLASFLGASFYLLNLGTLQHFFVPFEMFPTQFAALPWLFYLALKILRENKRKNFLIFAAVSFLASGQAYAPALFYAYFVALLLFVFTYWVLSKLNLGILKRALLVVVLVLATNAFWILPNIYSIKNQSSTISKAKINILFSPEAFLRNVDAGKIQDVLFQKNFLFDWRVFDYQTNSFTDLMQTWKLHLADQRVLWLGYGLAGIAVLGFLISLFRRDKIGMSLAAVSFLSLFFLVNINYSTGSLYRYFYDNFDAFKEGFRMPFTKFSILFEFCLSFFFGYFFLRLFSKKFTIPASILVFAGLVFFMLPAFKGNLISKIVQTDLPNEYSELFAWFKGKYGRVAKLPLHSFWGWEYHSWGYEGSGFLTYGLSNPLLDRDFDRWSPGNESFYSEAAFALYANDAENFGKVLEKYQVKYLLLDESIINAGGSDEILFIPQTKEILASLGIREVAKYGFLTVYETNFGGGFVSAPATFSRFDTDSTYSQVDTVFASYGNYINDSEGVTFPFVNFDRRMGIKIKDVGDRILVESRELQFEGAKDLLYPEIVLGQSKESPRVSVNDEKRVQVSFQIDQKISADLASPDQEGRFQNCDFKKIGSVERRIIGGKITYLATNGGVACEFFNFPEVSQSEGYVFHIKGENKQGRSLKFYLQNWETGRMDLEELLPSGNFNEYYFVLPSTISNQPLTINSGYSLNLETRSFGRIASENTIETAEFIPVPIEWLREIRLQPTAGQLDGLTANNLKINSVKKTGTWLYKVQTEGEGLLELGQGYEEGWLGFTLIPNTSRYQIQKLRHVRVNSWANGWIIPSNQVTNNQVTILFWPQLLEYFGFGVLALALVTLCFDLRLKRRYTTR